MNAQEIGTRGDGATLDLRARARMFWREFLWLWGVAVVVDALSFWFLHGSPEMRAHELIVPVPFLSGVPLYSAVIAQGAVQLAIYVGAGLWAARRVGLGAPVLEAWLCREPIGPRLRVSLVSIFLIALLIVACDCLADSSVFHPNRKQEAVASEQLVNSTTGATLEKMLERAGMVAKEPMTSVALVLSDLNDAISGQLASRLFGVSVVALLLLLIFETPGTPADRRIFWAAILIVTLIRAAFYGVQLHENTSAVSAIFEWLGIRLPGDPLWLIAARDGVRTVPLGVGLGWLYVRYGLEASIVAAFLASVMTYVAMIVWLTHFA